jgi:hypothetical protein
MDRPRLWLGRIAYGAQGVGLLATIGIGVYTISGWYGIDKDWPHVIPMLLFSASPYLGLALLTLVLSRSLVQAVLGLLASLAITTLGLLILIDAFIVRPGVMSGFVLMGLLTTQWTGVVMAWAAAGLDALIRWLIARR